MTDTTADYRRGRSVVFRLRVHLVFVTKYRRDPITDRVREVLITTAREVAARHGAAIIAADGEGDHLHLLVDYPPKVSVTSLVIALKTNTSRVIREQGFPEVRSQLWGEHFWSPSYFAESTGPTTLENIKKYIENQRAPSRGPGRPRTR